MPPSNDSSIPVDPIDRERAVRIANEHLAQHPARDLGGDRYVGVYAIYSPEELEAESFRKPILWHFENPGRCWTCYCATLGPPTMIQSSYILLVSCDDGRVVYAGSANDEG